MLYSSGQNKCNAFVFVHWNQSIWGSPVAIENPYLEKTMTWMTSQMKQFEVNQSNGLLTALDNAALWSSSLCFNAFPCERVLLLLSMSTINKISQPVPEAAMQAQAMMPLPPSFTDELVWFGLWAQPFFTFPSRCWKSFVAHICTFLLLMRGVDVMICYTMLFVFRQPWSACFVYNVFGSLLPGVSLSETTSTSFLILQKMFFCLKFPMRGTNKGLSYLILNTKYRESKATLIEVPVYLCTWCMFACCPCGFPLGAPVSSHCPKSGVRSMGNRAAFWCGCAYGCLPLCVSLVMYWRTVQDVRHLNTSARRQPGSTSTSLWPLKG